jgi:hypothetical protein
MRMPVPIINNILSPNGSTLGGTTVQILGSGFNGTVAVSFGGIAATSFHVVNDTQLTATSPNHPTGAVDIVVTNATGPSLPSVADQFFFAVPAPIVNGVFPSSGPTSGGTSITISGSKFTGATGVFFGTAQAAGFAVNNDGQITATAPPSNSGTVDIQVATANGTSATNPNDRFLFQPPPAPVVQSVTPSSGPTSGGTTVSIQGANFLGATSVTFGGTPAASFTVNSSTQITAVSPAHAAGPADVQVATPNGTSAVNANDVFQYTSAVPIVTSVSPNSGPTGTQVLVSGSNFQNTTAVSFGSTPAASFTILSSTQIQAVVPAAGAGTVDVIVANLQGSSSPTPGDQFLHQ